MVAMESVQDLLPESDRRAAIGCSLVDQDVLILSWEALGALEGPVQGRLNAEQGSLCLCAVAGGHGNSHRHQQRLKNNVSLGTICVLSICSGLSCSEFSFRDL